MTMPMTGWILILASVLIRMRTVLSPWGWIAGPRLVASGGVMSDEERARELNKQLRRARQGTDGKFLQKIRKQAKLAS
jgi:hypothetical protein